MAMFFSNPHYDPAKPHHRPDGFRNPDGALDVIGGFWRWQRERRMTGVPHPPAAGYPAFAEAWRVPADFGGDTGVPRFWWLGHATVLLRIGGAYVITDPHLTARASPLSFAGPKRLVPAPVKVDELPVVDVALISHNHYDHLDRGTLKALLRRNPAMTCCVPLGLGGWLRRRGVRRVKELDWWDKRELGELEICCVPAQHWSSRLILDRNHTLWSGWVLRHKGFSFYFAGDTGYTPALKEISERLGPPTLAALPIGAYEPRWFMGPQHVDPPEAVRLHQALGIKRSLAIHWGTFELADDSLDAPVPALQRALQAADLGAEDFLVIRQGESRAL